MTFKAPKPSAMIGHSELENRAPLLVSVQSVVEAKQIAHCPLSILDFKDPRAGALGRCADPVLSDAANHLVATGLSAIQLSAALGELVDWSIDLMPPSRFTFVKAGPAGIECPQVMRDALQNFKAEADEGYIPVAVSYADHLAANCLLPEQILDIAIDLGMRYFLLDTMAKDGRSLLDYMPIKRLAQLTNRCRDNNVTSVFAGSLSLEQLSHISEASPNLLGVRGAVCSGTRESEIAPAKVLRWCDALTAGDDIADQIRREDISEMA